MRAAFFFFLWYLNEQGKEETKPCWVSDCCLAPIVQLFHGENKLIAMMKWDDDDEVHFVLDQPAVDRVFEHRSGQIKDYIIGIKSKYWLALNQDNVSEWCNMYIHGLLFQWTSTIKNQTTRGEDSYRCSNTRSTALEESTLTITPPIRFKNLKLTISLHFDLINFLDNS
jgi:hypothetical protein